ncbi:MAG: NAD-binding protein [Thermoleophilia bacterium]
MKGLAAELAYFFRGRIRRNVKLLSGYLLFLLVFILVCSYIFDYLMLTLEGRKFSFISGIYWTITVMTTLGFGDITFESDGGRLFAAIVTVSGVLFLLILLPFGMITLFVAPWIEDRLRYRPPDRVPSGLRDHVLIAGWDPVTEKLVDSLRARGAPFAVLTSRIEEATRLDDAGVSVVHGFPTDGKVLELAGVCRARALVANLSDTDNTNLVLSTKRLCDVESIVLLDESERARFLELAGAGRVVALKHLLGQQLGVRSTTKGAYAHVVDSFGDLLFAEMPVYGTPWPGRTLAQAGIREQTGVTVIGIWERGRFTLAGPDTRISAGSVVLFAGTADQIKAVEKLAGESAEDDFVLILGFGRVGSSAAAFLRQNGVPYRAVDLETPQRGHEDENLVVGDASHQEVLEEVGILQAKGLIVTTSDDGINVFLTLVARHLNPHVRIVSRANRDQNVEELYAAGADFVVSVASVGANILLNALEGKETVFLSEGIHIFRSYVGPKLAGRRLGETRIPARSGAVVVAIASPEGNHLASPRAETLLKRGEMLLLVGTPESEHRFAETFRD